MREMIRRATEFATTGRTLEGVAYRFDHPSRVVDPGKPAYLEAFARGSATKTITERQSFPVDYFHGLMSGTPGARSRWSGEVFGGVVFRAGADGLEFTAKLSNTRGADEMLDLIIDGAIGDVSIAAYPIKTSNRGGVTWRDEIAIAALSLAPVGMGQHDGAKVLAVRARDGDGGYGAARLEALRRRRAVIVAAVSATRA